MWANSCHHKLDSFVWKTFRNIKKAKQKNSIVHAMKVYYLLVFATIVGPQLIGGHSPVFGLNYPVKRSPVDCSSCEDGELVADRSSCSSYYLCVGGQALRQTCGPGLLFDSRTRSCNLDYLVDCPVNRYQGYNDNDCKPHVIDYIWPFGSRYEEYNKYIHRRPPVVVPEYRPHVIRPNPYVTPSNRVNDETTTCAPTTVTTTNAPRAVTTTTVTTTCAPTTAPTSCAPTSATTPCNSSGGSGSGGGSGNGSGSGSGSGGSGSGGSGNGGSGSGCSGGSGSGGSGSGGSGSGGSGNGNGGSGNGSGCNGIVTQPPPTTTCSTTTTCPTTTQSSSDSGNCNGNGNGSGNGGSGNGSGNGGSGNGSGNGGSGSECSGGSGNGGSGSGGSGSGGSGNGGSGNGGSGNGSGCNGIVTQPPPTTTCSTTTCSTTTCPTTTQSSSDSGNYNGNGDRNNGNVRLNYLMSYNDCASLADNTILLDLKHCRRYYVCTNRRAKRVRCSIGQWYDKDAHSCRPRAEVTNCVANKN
ncbi:uncharacterized protein LOC101891419 [Musca domestica]|uniref:Uncharacterized protein LOC101891419 n=1 Tax=Musca domestica TaxID=7370 RepID=A0A9J7CX48_MUSDO|nr:uncharacterized protein LOC101891419 [Musca domestica]